MDDDLHFEQVLVTGGNRNFAYIVGCRVTGQAALVDPAYEPERLIDMADGAGLRITHLLNTHGHPDHTNGNETVLELCPDAQLVAHPDDVDDPDVPVAGGETLAVGKVRIDVIASPGHTPGHVCFLVNQRKLITGDVLFVGKIGGTGAGFSRSDPRVQHHTLFEVLLKLPDDVEVWPGHNFGVQPSSTIGHERRTNPFLLRPDFDDFMWLKDNWAQFKKEHGIP